MLRRLKILFMVIGIGSVGLVTISAAYFFTLRAPEDSSSQDSCIDGQVVILDIQFINDTHYVLIEETSGIADKVSFIHLLETNYPSRYHCFHKQNILDSKAIDYGLDNQQQWPIGIAIQNNNIELSHSQNQSEAVPLVNIIPQWLE